MEHGPSELFYRPGSAIEEALAGGPDFDHVVLSSMSMKSMERDDRVSLSPEALEVADAIAVYYSGDVVTMAAQRLAALRGLDASHKVAAATGVVSEPRFVFRLNPDGSPQSTEQLLTEATGFYARHPKVLAVTKAVRDNIDPQGRYTNSITFGFSAGLLLIDNGMQMTPENIRAMRSNGALRHELTRLISTILPDHGMFL